MTVNVSLKDYVRETLLEISSGIREAQSDPVVGHLIGRSANMTAIEGLGQDVQGNVVSAVAFDVATTVEESTAGKVGGSVKVVALGGFEAGGNREAKSAAISRVTFKVTMAQPKPEDQTRSEAEQQARDSAALREAARRLNGPDSWMR